MLIISLDEQQFSNLTNLGPVCLQFAFVPFAFETEPKIPLQFVSKGILPIFSSRSFMVSGFAFRSLIHFESFCVYGVRKCSIISLLHAAVLFSQNHTLKRLSLLQCIYSCLRCHRLIDHFILFMGFSWQELISVCIYLWLPILFH